MDKKEMARLIMYVLTKVAQLAMVIVALYFMAIGEYVKGGSVFVAVMAMALLDISMEASGIKEELKRFNELAEDVLGDEEEEDTYEPTALSIDGITQKTTVCKVKK